MKPWGRSPGLFLFKDNSLGARILACSRHTGPALTAVSSFSNRPVRLSGTLFESVGDGNASRHHQETGFGPRLRLYRGRGWEGVLLPPQLHRGQLRQAAGWREGFLRNRDEPQGATREDRPHRLRNEPASPGRKPGAFFTLVPPRHAGRPGGDVSSTIRPNRPGERQGCGG